MNTIKLKVVGNIGAREKQVQLEEDGGMDRDQ